MASFSSAARYTIGIALYALAGPPIGGLVAWLGMGAPSLRSPLPFIAGSWLEGGALALGVGMLAAVGAWRGLSQWWVPVGAAFLACALFILISSGGEIEGMLRLARVFVPPSLVASFVCWLLTRRLFKHRGRQ